MRGEADLGFLEFNVIEKRRGIRHEENRAFGVTGYIVAGISRRF